MPVGGPATAAQPLQGAQEAPQRAKPQVLLPVPTLGKRCLVAFLEALRAIG